MFGEIAFSHGKLRKIEPKELRFREKIKNSNESLKIY